MNFSECVFQHASEDFDLLEEICKRAHNNYIIIIIISKKWLLLVIAQNRVLSFSWQWWSCA